VAAKSGRNKVLLVACVIGLLVVAFGVVHFAEQIWWGRLFLLACMLVSIGRGLYLYATRRRGPGNP
jgi:disulfide bond formation protein DsbB